MLKIFKIRILGPLCLASLGLEWIGSTSFIFDSLIAHYICFYFPRIPEPLCLASLRLEKIESSSFTFDSVAAHYFFFPGFQTRFASPRSGWMWLNQTSHLQHNIFVFCPNENLKKNTKICKIPWKMAFEKSWKFEK